MIKSLLSCISELPLRRSRDRYEEEEEDEEISTKVYFILDTNNVILQIQLSFFAIFL
ncbi:MAG TPA: hypothetical protein VD815_09195 [Candidatus Saccharimonadales bacterium]|nr:hypothetical protein [Candidatus Saccharimonadales bacterium]